MKRTCLQETNGDFAPFFHNHHRWRRFCRDQEKISVGFFYAQILCAQASSDICDFQQSYSVCVRVRVSMHVLKFVWTVATRARNIIVSLGASRLSR